MNLHGIISSSQKLITDNAPTILTATGVVGTVATAVLAGKASWTAKDKLDKIDIPKTPEDGELLRATTKDKVLAVAPLYIPAVVVGTGTIVCIVFAHKIDATRLAAMAGAYALSENKLKEFKNKTEDLLGIEKKQEIQAAVADDKLEDQKAQKPQIFMLGVEEALIFDLYSGRYFKARPEAIYAAQNTINAGVIAKNYMKLHEFWDLIGLDQNSMSDIMGFDLENLLDVEFTPHQNENDMPYLMMEYTPVSLARRLHQR